MLQSGKGTNAVFNDTHVEFVKPDRLEKLGIRSTEAQSAKRLSNLGKALAVYANDYQGRYADTVHEIFQKDYLNRKNLKWLSENAEYLGKGKTMMDDPGIVLAYDKTMLQAGKGTNVLFSSLDLEIGADVTITGKIGKVPSYHDVAWDNDSGGTLMVIPDSGARIIALAGATNLKEALNTARASMDLLRKSESKGILAKQNKFVAVLTDQGNLAIIEITSYDSEKGTIEWLLVKGIENLLSRNNLHQLAIALWIYADDHNHKMPENLNEVKTNIPNENVFRWLLDNVQYINQGIRRPGHREPVAFDKKMLEKGEGTNILFSDSHVEFVEPDSLEKFGIRATGAESAKRLSNLGKAVIVYANDDEKGRFPDTMGELERRDYIFKEDFQWLSRV
jgi:hypothetical protein